MNTTSNVPDKGSERTWYTENSAYAFLVDRPLTFGHSQLRVSILPGISEEDAFSLAAKHITICIGRFRSTFMSLDLGNWGPLAQYTVTLGQYVKTLVLKASANENQEEYKVHLVPCFSSHIEAANNLYQKRFEKPEGGLLFWIGQCEDRVDRDAQQRDTIVLERVKSFCLAGLAAILRCPTQPAQAA